jgi:hypothetical protein
VVGDMRGYVESGVGVADRVLERRIGNEDGVER